MLAGVSLGLISWSSGTYFIYWRISYYAGVLGAFEVYQEGCRKETEADLRAAYCKHLYLVLCIELQQQGEHIPDHERGQAVHPALWGYQHHQGLCSLTKICAKTTSHFRLNKVQK